MYGEDCPLVHFRESYSQMNNVSMCTMRNANTALIALTNGQGKSPNEDLITTFNQIITWSLFIINIDRSYTLHTQSLAHSPSG